MPLKVDIRGVKELERSLLALGKFGSAAKVTRQGLRPGAAEVREEVRRRAPVRTGAYRKSIKVRIGNARRNLSNTVARLYVASVGKRAPLSHLLEYGTINMRAFPHFRDVAERKLLSIVNGFSRVYWPKFEKEVKRLAIRNAVRSARRG